MMTLLDRLKNFRTTALGVVVGTIVYAVIAEVERQCSCDLSNLEWLSFVSVIQGALSHDKKKEDVGVPNIKQGGSDVET